MKLNLSKLIDSTKNVWKRFPMCLVFLAALTVQMISYLFLEKNFDALTFFLSVGMLVSLLLHLCSKKINWLWIIPYLLLAADSYGLHVQDEINDSVAIAQFTAILALSVGICFLPFRKEKNDMKSWNFVFSVAFSAGIGMLIGIVMCAGLCLLYYGSSELFGFESSWKIGETIAILCLVTLPTLLFLSLIRVPEDNQPTKVDGFLLGVIRYLFLPLAILYMIVLYVYGVQIVATWTLPKGMLSTLISTLMIVVILVTFLLYPRLLSGESSWETKVIRWLPLFVIPLLVLMSVGIGRRFMDYGLTARRLYLLTLNVWFYIVAIGLCICRARRIHWISISFTLLLIASSCHPWNYNNLYRNLLIDNFDTLVAKYHIVIKGLNNDKFVHCLRNMPDADARKLYTTMQAMRQFDYKLAGRKFDKEADIAIYDTYEEYMGIKRNSKGKYIDLAERNYIDIAYSFKGKDISVPTGYKYMRVKDYERDVPVKDHNDSTVTFDCDGLGAVTVNHKKLNDSQICVCPIKGKNAVLVMTDLHMYVEKADDEHTLSYSGVVYYNR